MDLGLTACRKYKDFLDSITPPEWFESQASKLQRRKDAMMAEWQVFSNPSGQGCLAGF